MSLIPGNFTDGVLTLSDDASHSATLALSNGDLAIAALVPSGRALEVFESRGAVVGARKGARARPTLTVSAICAAPLHDFHALALGVTAGFTSTMAGIGDYAANDLSFTLNYGAESRSFTAQDVVLTGYEFTEGSPNTIALSFEILGPMTVDGTTVIPSR